MKHYCFYVYILTNPSKTTLYVGFTKNLSVRLFQHNKNKGKRKTFAGRYYCYNLIYYEIFKYVSEALERERQIKRWSRKKKIQLINQLNPKWRSLNATFYLTE